MFRAGFCAIVGRPNVGKSTLMNRMLGEKLAVVTPKPQTTRNRIRGIKNRPDAQIVFVDTPGIHRGRSSLNQFMVHEALQAAGECDVVLLMIEAPRGSAAEAAKRDVTEGEGNALVVEALSQLRKPVVLAVNKVDLLSEKDALLPLIDGWQKRLTLQAIVPISATQGDGVEAVENEVACLLPEGEPLFPDDILTDRAERFLAAELVREQIFLMLREEVPYSTAVTVESWKERAEKQDVVINAVIHVERDSQKAIVIGEGGRMVRDIGVKARQEIGRLLGCPVHLKLFVKVDPDWTTRAGALRQLGYE